MFSYPIMKKIVLENTRVTPFQLPVASHEYD